MKLRDRLIVAGTFAAIALAFVALIMIQPYMEACAYERVTGKHVSAWDALWLDLRVQEGAAAQ
jgi:hypothetical protein